MVGMVQGVSRALALPIGCGIGGLPAGRRICIFTAKQFHMIEQSVGLIGHLVGGGGELFGGGGVALSDVIDLSHGAIDLSHAGGLFPRRRGHFLDQLRSFLDRRHQASQQFPRALGDTDAGRSEGTDCLSGTLAAFGKLSDFG